MERRQEIWFWLLVRTCKENKYPEITLNLEGIDEKISNRITKARKMIAYLNDILWRKSITKNEIHIYETTVKNAMLYGVWWRCRSLHLRITQHTADSYFQFDNVFTAYLNSEMPILQTYYNIWYIGSIRYWAT